MRSQRALLALLFCFLFDAAVPFEPAARGVQLEIEDQGEEGVCARRRHAERPAPADAPAPRTLALAAAAPDLGASAARGAQTRQADAGADRAVPSRARTHALDPASPAEDH